MLPYERYEIQIVCNIQSVGTFCVIIINISLEINYVIISSCPFKHCSIWRRNYILVFHLTPAIMICKIFNSAVISANCLLSLKKSAIIFVQTDVILCGLYSLIRQHGRWAQSHLTSICRVKAVQFFSPSVRHLLSTSDLPGRCWVPEESIWVSQTQISV